MSDEDLSDEQLEVIGKLAESGALGATAYSTRQLVREVKRHRTALAADMERVRSVVREAVDDELTERKYKAALGIDAPRIFDAIATRVAEQLATPVFHDMERIRKIADEEIGIWQSSNDHGSVADVANAIAYRAAVQLPDPVLRGLRLLSASGVVSDNPDLVAARAWIESLVP